MEAVWLRVFREVANKVAFRVKLVKCIGQMHTKWQKQNGYK